MTLENPHDKFVMYIPQYKIKIIYLEGDLGK